MMRLLYKRKTLTLSIAMNALLLCALSMLLYLVYPQLLYDLDSAYSLWGRYSVRTYRQNGGERAYCEVIAGYRRLYSTSGTLAFYVEKWGVHLTGDDAPVLVIRQWWGSAHGDSQYLFLKIDGSVVKRITVVDHLAGVECRDLNGDGVDEIAGVDRAYEYFLGDCYAGSPRPEVILSFDKTQGKFVLNRRLMSKPPLPQDQFDELSSKYKSDPRWSEESRPPSDLFDTMLRLIYTGNEKQAWELFAASWPEGATASKEEYRENIKSELGCSFYYPAVAGWNNGTL
jgi:hypothetical protein